MVPATRPKIDFLHKKYIYFYVPPAYDLRKKQQYYEKQLRIELKKDLAILVPYWADKLGVSANEVGINPHYSSILFK